MSFIVADKTNLLFMHIIYSNDPNSTKDTLCE